MASPDSQSWTTSRSHTSSSHEDHDCFDDLSATKVSDFTSPESHFEESKDPHTDLRKAQSALREREARLDEREAALKKQQADLTEREDALDAAHERLIGGDGSDEEPADDSASIIDELREENGRLRAEVTASKQKSGRFLSQRAESDDADGRDRFRLSERNVTPGGGLPMGFDPQMMERWRVGHQMMAPRMPKFASSRAGGK
jgi:chromosome segregation ATPase